MSVKTKSSMKIWNDIRVGIIVFIVLSAILLTSGCVKPAAENKNQNEELSRLVELNGQNESGAEKIDQFQELLGVGEQYYFAGDYEASLKSFEEAIELNPDSSEVWDYKASVLLKLKRYNEALDAYDRGLLVNPNESFILNNKGNLLELLERNKEALETYERGLLVDPNNPVMWNNKGLLLDSLGRKEEALVAYNRSLELDSTNGLTWNNKASTLQQLKRYDESLEAFDKALESNSIINEHEFYLLIYSKRGILLMEMGDYIAAIESFDIALGIDPNFQETLKNRKTALEFLNKSTPKSTP